MIIQNHIINPEVPSPLKSLKKPEKKFPVIKTNSIPNPIYPLLGSNSINSLMPKDEFRKRTVLSVVKEKKDKDINELLKGHENIVEEKKIFKINSEFI